MNVKKRAKYKEALEKLRDYNPQPEIDITQFKIDNWVREEDAERAKTLFRWAIKVFLMGVLVGIFIGLRIAPQVAKIAGGLFGV